MSYAEGFLCPFFFFLFFAIVGFLCFFGIIDLDSDQCSVCSVSQNIECLEMENDLLKEKISILQDDDKYNSLKYENETLKKELSDLLK